MSYEIVVLDNTIRGYLRLRKVSVNGVPCSLCSTSGKQKRRPEWAASKGALELRFYLPRLKRRSAS
jgi:hypothetical protein